MKGDLNIHIDKIGLDEATAKIAEAYIESAKHRTKKTYRLEVGEEAKSVINAGIALGVLGILSYCTVTVFKIIYGAE